MRVVRSRRLVRVPPAPGPSCTIALRVGTRADGTQAEAAKAQIASLKTHARGPSTQSLILCWRARLFALGGNLKNVRLGLRGDDKPFGLLDDQRILVLDDTVGLRADDDAGYAGGGV
jgi:hypothetical protein